MKTPILGLKGRVKPSVINGGALVIEGSWTRNLWLDQGLDQIAETAICECFAVAVKGTGNDPTLEDLTGGSETYSITNGASTITRTAGTRDFTTDDVGKLMRFSTTPFAEFTITAFTDATHVDVSPNADATVSNKKIRLYSVQQTGLEAEVGRTITYSAVSGENKTVKVGNVATHTRTFIFPTEDTLIENVPSTNTYSQTGTTVERESGTRDFTVDDVGSTILFQQSGIEVEITAFTDADTVTVNNSETNLDQPIVLTKANSDKVETPAGTNTYSRAGAVVTRAAGTRDFTSGDVGKIIHFNTSNVEAKITVFTNATTVTVDTSGTLAAQNIRLYGFTDYSEVGFSHSEETDENLNVRVLLDTPVRVYVSTPLRASDQLKLTYECTVTVEPDTATVGSLTGIISDPGNLMSGNKSGKSAIESFAVSVVSTDGNTDLSFADLEPFYEGFAALSLDTEALAPLTTNVRTNGVASVDMTADSYTQGSFLKTFQAIFGLNDAVGTAWRSLMIHDPESGSAIYTFLYDANQKKDGTHTFSVTFQKAWGRDLS